MHVKPEHTRYQSCRNSATPNTADTKQSQTLFNNGSTARFKEVTQFWDKSTNYQILKRSLMIYVPQWKDLGNQVTNQLSWLLSVWRSSKSRPKITELHTGSCRLKLATIDRSLIQFVFAMCVLDHFAKFTLHHRCHPKSQYNSSKCNQQYFVFPSIYN